MTPSGTVTVPACQRWDSNGQWCRSCTGRTFPRLGNAQFHTEYMHFGQTLLALTHANKATGMTILVHSSGPRCTLCGYRRSSTIPPHTAPHRCRLPERMFLSNPQRSSRCRGSSAMSTLPGSTCLGCIPSPELPRRYRNGPRCSPCTMFHSPRPGTPPPHTEDRLTCPLPTGWSLLGKARAPACLMLDIGDLEGRRYILHC